MLRPSRWLGKAVRYGLRVSDTHGPDKTMQMVEKAMVGDNWRKEYRRHVCWPGCGCVGLHLPGVQMCACVFLSPSLGQRPKGPAVAIQVPWLTRISSPLVDLVVS